MLVMSLRQVKAEFPAARMYLLFDRRKQKRLDLTQAAMRELLLTTDNTEVIYMLLGVWE